MAIDDTKKNILNFMSYMRYLFNTTDHLPVRKYIFILVSIVLPYRRFPVLKTRYVSHVSYHMSEEWTSKFNFNHLVHAIFLNSSSPLTASEDASKYIVPVKKNISFSF